MIFGKTAFGLALTVLLALPIRADQDWGASFGTIRQAASAVRSVQASFRQHKRLAILKQPLVSTGRFVFQAPDSIRWEYESPIRSLLVMERSRLQRFAWRAGRWVPDASQRVEAMRVVVEEIRSWLTGRFGDSQVFSARLLPGSPARVELTPLQTSMAEFIQRIVLTLAERPGQLSCVEIIEGPDATTRIEFEQVELDAALPAGTFGTPE